ncbi:MAG: L-dopachrome tautomerase-related protein [Azovibrio sp.]
MKNTLKTLAKTSLFLLMLQAGLAAQAAQPTYPQPGTLEEVAQLPIRPGNVTATAQGRVFATVHPLDKPSGLQLIEITGPNSYKPWPDSKLQSPANQPSDATIDTPLGITRDTMGRLWITDMGLNLGKTRLWAFDIESGAVAQKIELPADVAPKDSFIQDLAVDAERGWVYLADINNPALLAVNIATGKTRRFEGHPSLQPEKEAVMRVGGELTYFGGKPSSVGVNPITLSKDGETLYFGAMNGTHWYALPAHLLREDATATEIGANIHVVGPKPVSDGAATDDAGNHFFTNLNEDGIDQLDTTGQLKPLVRDNRLTWPDSVQFGPESWLYISVNQLHLTSAFTGGADRGQPPYRIMRVWTGTGGTAR